MAVGQENLPISAGAMVQPLVGETNPNTVGPQAIQQLVDAFHNGVVNADDIIQRIGEVGQSQRKALIESLGEYVSPQAIQSRMSAHVAQSAQNALAAQQAGAASSLVQPATNLAQQQVGAQTASVVQGPQGLQSFQQFAPWYGEDMEQFRNPDGSHDFQAAAMRGNKMAGEMSLATAWIDQLTPVADRPVTDAAGNKYVQKVNKFGVNVTPPDPQSGFPGAPAYWAYVKQLNQYLPDFHPARKQFMLVPTGANSVVPGHPMVQPSGAQAPTPPLVEPTAAPAAPTIGIPTEAAKGNYQTPQEIKSALVQDPAYKNWAEQAKYAENFKTLADKLEAQPDQSKEVQTNNDIALAEDVIKLFDPTSRIVEFKWDKLEQAQPWLEKIGAAKQLIMKNGVFTPESRARLIEMGDEMTAAMATTVKGRLQQAAGIAQSSAAIAGQNPAEWLNNTLTPNEQRVAAGEPFRVPKAAQGKPSAPGAVGPTITLPSGKKVYRGADGQMYLAQ